MHVSSTGTSFEYTLGKLQSTNRCSIKHGRPKGKTNVAQQNSKILTIRHRQDRAKEGNFHARTGYQFLQKRPDVSLHGLQQRSAAKLLVLRKGLIGRSMHVLYLQRILQQSRGPAAGAQIRGRLKSHRMAAIPARSHRPQEVSPSA